MTDTRLKIFRKKIQYLDTSKSDIFLDIFESSKLKNIEEHHRLDRLTKFQRLKRSITGDIACFIISGIQLYSSIYDYQDW